MATYTVKERLCLTEDGKLVKEGDPKARWLYATPGDEIPLEEAKKHGLVKEERKPSKDKQPSKPADKSQS